MDAGKKADYHKTLGDAGLETINEGRLEFNLPPLDGGDTVYKQQQDFPLNVIKDNVLPTQSAAPVAPVPAPQPAADPQTQKALAELFLLKAVQAARTEVTQ
jgi:hypothetical protein